MQYNNLRPGLRSLLSDVILTVKNKYGNPIIYVLLLCEAIMLQSNRVLQKEQTELYAIEKKLVNILPAIQEALNSLKVEELHLKSQSVDEVMSKAATSINAITESVAQNINDEQINSQEINLQLFGSQFDVENDSD